MLVRGEKRINLTEVAAGLSAYFLLLTMTARGHWNILNILRGKDANKTKLSFKNKVKINTL